MSEEEKEAINNLRLYSTNVGFSEYDGTTCVLRAKDVQIVLNLTGKQYVELNNLKEIEKSHREENGKLRVELEKKQNKIQALEKQHDYDIQMIDEVKGNAVKWANELEQEKEKNKDLQKQLNGAFDRGFIHKDKIRAKVIQVKDRPVKDEFITATQGKLNTIIVLEELLEEV